jgi:murein DD-endopeptidase MepM/ murein hydrolase activator NlpD
VPEGRSGTRGLWVAVGLSAAALSFAALQGGDGGREGSAVPDRTDPSATPVVTIEADSAAVTWASPPAGFGPLAIDRHTIRPGEPLDLALRDLALTPEERRDAVAALREEVDVRRVLPGETVEIARTAEGNLHAVTLHRDALRQVVVRFPEGRTAFAESMQRETDVHVCRIEGELHGSLYEAVLEAGGDANLTMRFADLLGWQVDFLTEPRDGDHFRIVVREDFLDGERLAFGKILAAEYTGAQATARAVRYVDSDGTLDWYDDQGHSVRREFLKSPLNFRRISSRFSANRRHPILKTVRPHWGVDYAAPVGTPVSALGSGVVRFAGRKGGFGNYIEVRHNGTFTTCYGHLSRFAKGIRNGARVEQGDVIGYVGSTGLSTGPHLDFRVRRNGRFVDPLKLDSPPGRELAGEGFARFEAYRERAWELAGRLGVGESAPEGQAWARAGLSGDAETIMASVDRADPEMPGRGPGR